MWATWAAARLYATALGIFGCFAFWVLVCSADDSPLRKALALGMGTMQENWIATGRWATRTTTMMRTSFSTL